MDAPDRLLHVGPYKTGTTAVQRAFHRSRRRLAAHGVGYLGDLLQPRDAAVALLAIDGPDGPPARTPLEWEHLMKQADDSDLPTAVLSSELLCTAGDGARARLVEDFLGPDGRVVITLRSLGRIMPSQWQQSVQAGMTTTLDRFVRRQLRAWPGETTGFWRRHRHDLLVQRWAGLIGPDRVAVVVADETDPAFLVGRFAAMLGLPDGVLVADGGAVNRSLTWEEVEAIRAFNQGFRARLAEIGNPDRRPREPKLWRSHAWRWFKEREPDPSHHPVRLPAWAAEDVAGHSEAVVEGILASGVSVSGPVEQLTAPPPVTVGPLPDTVESRIAGQVAARIAETLLRELEHAPASGTART